MSRLLCDEREPLNAVREIDTSALIERRTDVGQPPIIDQIM
jgi:hypothetical protein